MRHPVHEGWAFAIFALLLLGYAAFSTRLAASPVSSAIVFTIAGVLLGPMVLGLFGVEVDTEWIKRLAEVTLAIALFTDAARIDLKQLRKQLGLPVRLLGIGLPLTIVVGIVLAALVFPSMLLVEAALIAIILAPTDAALGQRVVTDPAVPVRVRQSLNVESGLNDGIAVPFYLLALELARAEVADAPVAHFLQLAAQQIGLGIVAGVVGGVIGGLVIRRWLAGGDAENPWRQLVMFAAAALAYSVALGLGGSVFIATFTGGVAFAWASGQTSLDLAYFSEQTGAVLSALTFTMFGAAAVTLVVSEFSWAVFAYVILSLTVVRMVPVAIALLGSGTHTPTVAFIGWFGPRGLASIVFGLGLIGVGLPHASQVLAVIFATVLFSVFAHGLSAPGLTVMYSRWYAALPRKPEAEACDVHENRVRLGLRR
jgi:sodium/hydrogen antiporter